MIWQVAVGILLGWCLIKILSGILNVKLDDIYEIKDELWFFALLVLVPALVVVAVIYRSSVHEFLLLLFHRDVVLWWMIPSGIITVINVWREKRVAKVDNREPPI